MNTHSLISCLQFYNSSESSVRKVMLETFRDHSLSTAKQGDIIATWREINPSPIMKQLSGNLSAWSPMSSVLHFKWTSFQLQSHFHKCALDLHLKHPKGKGNISIEKGIRSKVKCRSSAHFPSIWGVKSSPNIIFPLLCWFHAYKLCLQDKLMMMNYFQSKVSPYFSKWDVRKQTCIFKVRDFCYTHTLTSTVVKESKLTARKGQNIFSLFRGMNSFWHRDEFWQVDGVGTIVHSHKFITKNLPLSTGKNILQLPGR